MKVNELIEKHAKVTEADLEWSWEVRLKQFAIELLELVKNEATVQKCVIPDFLEREVDKALEQLRK